MKKGVTIVEMIVYVAVLSLIATAFVTMSINMMSLKSKTVSQQEIESNLRFISQKINYEIRNAKAISATTATSITLTTVDSSRDPTVFDLSGGDIRMGFGSAGSCPSTSPCILNSTMVNISTFSVTDMSDAGGKTENIRYTIAGNYINNTGRADFAANGSINGSAEIRSR
jgi:hypothetical protein